MRATLIKFVSLLLSVGLLALAGEAAACNTGCAPPAPPTRPHNPTPPNMPCTSCGGHGGGGDVLAYVLTYQWVDGELYIGQVGTRQKARGQGLARACLVASLQAAVDSGRYHQVDLTVDSENPTGAGVLYESVGFTATRTMASYVRDEQPPDAG